MGRRTPAAFCLMDVGFLSDAKFRKLARRLPDPDELNSAIGAYFVALATSRRNGSHRIDAQAETDSRYIGDLQAVGLLEEDGFPQKAWSAWDAMSPQKVAGLARAEKAIRNDAGRFTSALDSAGPAGSAGPAFPSPPLLSPQRTEGVQGEVDAGEAGVFAFLAQHGAAIRPDAPLGRRLLGLIERRGSEAVAKEAEDMAKVEPMMSDRQWVLGLENGLEAIPSGRKTADEAVAEETQVRNDARYQRMIERRLEWYRQTGKWPADWGPMPTGSAA